MIKWCQCSVSYFPGKMLRYDVGRVYFASVQIYTSLGNGKHTHNTPCTCLKDGLQCSLHVYSPQYEDFQFMCTLFWLLSSLLRLVNIRKLERDFGKRMWNLRWPSATGISSNPVSFSFSEPGKSFSEKSLIWALLSQLIEFLVQPTLSSSIIHSQWQLVGASAVVCPQVPNDPRAPEGLECMGGARLLTILTNSHDTSSPLYERAGKPSCGDGRHVLKRNIKQPRRHGHPEAVNAPRAGDQFRNENSWVKLKWWCWIGIRERQCPIK